MSLNACAALVEKADPERFRATMAAPVGARRVLFPLYAFNVEVARAPWVTQEPMIAEMRLQWWRDALEEIAGDKKPRKHEVVDALAEVLDAEGAALLDGLVAARRWDIYKDPFEDAAHFDSYIDATSGHLMWTAARLLGQRDEAVIRDFAYAAGVANWFRAIPDLEERGRKPLPDGSEAGVLSLATRAEAQLIAAIEQRNGVASDAAPVLYSGYLTRPVLHQIRKDPGKVARGALGLPPLREHLRFMHVALRGWWR
ncbi:squalene/phytoene synthase family protein [Loktanella sp. S4079]|uniref:squalene/phytoene synthase family protein n=1 Tax=Loktanella sp. S4079 TaxID=579483 RepID=UPI0005FA0539|nr:squalene/phytoene synthase family protein [Loktanella sp. S4079]KJZ20004.1 phytoene synthase [Loktanella sp. S4079]